MLMLAEHHQSTTSPLDKVCPQMGHINRTRTTHMHNCMSRRLDLLKRLEFISSSHARGRCSDGGASCVVPSQLHAVDACHAHTHTQLAI